MTETNVRPAVFFDRDGTLNHDAGYTHRAEDFRWIEGVPEAIRALNDARVLVFVVTNQSGIARGRYGRAEVEALHDHMNADLARIGAHIDDFRYCPYHPEGTVAEFAKPSRWRKPEPGMIEDLLHHWPVDMARSILIGDQPTDAEAAAAAGLPARLVALGETAAAVAEFLEERRRDG